MNPTPLAMLRSHPFVAGFDPHHVERLAKLARLEHFDRDQIWLRRSPWNVVAKAERHGFEGMLRTEDVLAKRPMSSERLREIIADVERLGIAYAYAPAIDEEIRYRVACGQALEAFRPAVEASERPARGLLNVVG